MKNKENMIEALKTVELDAINIKTGKRENMDVELIEVMKGVNKTPEDVCVIRHPIRGLITCKRKHLRGV